jgi:hypothetical protein
MDAVLDEHPGRAAHSRGAVRGVAAARWTEPSSILVAKIDPQGEDSGFGGGGSPPLRGWSSPSASSLMPSLVVEANPVLGFVGGMSCAKYSLQGKP